MSGLAPGPIPAPTATPGFAADVRRGLTASPKFLEPKHFYDELGSALFTAICALPEYYLTRAESAILAAHAGEMTAGVAAPLRLVELGSGDAVKTRYLIEAALARQPDLEYRPIDISESALEASSKRLLGVYPSLRVTPWVGDYGQGLAALAREPPPGDGVQTLVLFLGSTLGNLHLPQARELLAGVRALLRPGGAFLLGVDLEEVRGDPHPGLRRPAGGHLRLQPQPPGADQPRVGRRVRRATIPPPRPLRPRARTDRDPHRQPGRSGRPHPRPRPRGRFRRRRDDPQRVFLQVRPGAGGRPRRRRRPHRRRLLDRPGRLLPVCAVCHAPSCLMHGTLSGALKA